MGRRIEQAFKSLLGKAGYSKKAKSEVWKWYRLPPRKRKAVENWRSRAWLIDPNKTRITMSSDEVLE